MFHSGDDDIHSDLSVKKEENNDILEPRCSGRKYITIQKNLNCFLLCFNLMNEFPGKSLWDALSLIF